MLVPVNYTCTDAHTRIEYTRNCHTHVNFPIYRMSQIIPFLLCLGASVYKSTVPINNAQCIHVLVLITWFAIFP